MKTALVTGSSGLIGSEMVSFLDERGWRVHGVDNNMRADFFGPHGDTTWNLERLRRTTRRFEHHDLDVRDRAAMARIVAETKPALVVNAVGTLNLLEAVRQHAPEAPFAFLSTNKVYGDAPNELELVELETRWDYADGRDGIDESMRIDTTMHSLFGASKLAADVLVQEYGRYFGMPTVCFRGAPLTGPNHSAAELHGFLAYVARAAREGLVYRIFGYKGKQVRDNIHSYDVCTAIMAFAESPTVAAVYNLGGGRANSISVIEAIDRFEELFGRPIEQRYVDEPRRGDHICYISDLGRFRSDYPDWEVSISLEEILAELAEAQARPRSKTA